MKSSAYQNPSKSKPFWAGLFTGLLVCLVLIGGSIFYLLQRPGIIMSELQKRGMLPVIEKTIVKSAEKTLASVPKQVLIEKQDALQKTFETLTTAYANDRLSESEMQALSSQLFNIISDQQITPQEIDSFLEFAGRQGK